MHSFKWSASIAIVVVLLVLSSAAHADTYKIYDLGTADAVNIQGMDDSGAVVLYSLINYQYTVYADGIESYVSTTDPGLTYDNGTPCTPALSPGMSVIGKASCNNSYEVFGGSYLDLSRGIYTGPDPTDFLQGGTVDTLVLNSAGDFAWSDGLHEETYMAIDLNSQVPEPNSILLLGTGLFAIAGIRRRLFQ